MQVCGGTQEIFLPMFEIQFKDAVQSPSEESEYTVSSHTTGWGTVWRSCVSVSGNQLATISIHQTIQAVSEELTRNDAETLTTFLKKEYEQEFTNDIAKSSSTDRTVWDWLGIDSHGKTTNTDVVTEKFERGLTGLEEARGQYSRLLGTHAASESLLTANSTVISTSHIPSTICVYFKIENIRFTDDTALMVISDDPSTAHTATDNGKDVPNKGIAYEVTAL